MTRLGAPARIALAAGAVVVAVVLFLVLRPDGDDESGSPAPPPVPPATTTPTQTETPPPSSPPPPAVTRVSIVVRGGSVAGGIRRVTIRKGRRVVLVVRADVEDEVHLHGYDRSADIAPGSPVRLEFRANLVGRFEVELEDRKLQIAELEVRP
jgi:hypothetical protein